VAVEVDLSQFEQVVVISRSMPRDLQWPDGGKLTVLTSNVTAEDCAKFAYKRQCRTPTTCCRVTDTGTGIPSDIIEKISSRSFSTRKSAKGTGLACRPSTVSSSNRWVRLRRLQAGHDGVPHLPAAPCAGREEALAQLPAAERRRSRAP